MGRNLRRAHFDLKRVLFAWAALLAVAMQAFVVQTHVDGFVGAPTAAYERSEIAAGPQLHQVSDAAQAACLTCEALASAGRLLLASDAAIVRADNVSFRDVAPEIRSAQAAPAHTWRSRAPPAFL